LVFGHRHRAPFAPLFFLSRRTCPPRSPLFPYTTLFRSAVASRKTTCRVGGEFRPLPAVVPGDSFRTVPNNEAGMTDTIRRIDYRSEEHTSELQSLRHLVCRLLLEKKKTACTTLVGGDGR